ncbi:hypothetical protein GVN21_16720 [Caulobacter sp. SLTY]|uniref:hypothetical protein n=1 Tax=Caulobacter sp. SLTY TaxID=2683262 RepID=UPI001412BBD6|nr:hypothetical protein [Caulobacter sp. SLTY]NBB17011.1 hypothetical protein [Caulobacter sp. SLTY]
MDRLTCIREGRSAARHLRQLARTGDVTPADLDRLLGKIDDGFETALDVEQLRATGDLPETLARMAAEGLRVTRGSFLTRPVPPPPSVLDWSGPDRVVGAEFQDDPHVVAAARLMLGLDDAGPNRLRTVKGLGVIEGGRP